MRNSAGSRKQHLAGIMDEIVDAELDHDGFLMHHSRNNRILVIGYDGDASLSGALSSETGKSAHCFR
ncbi:hypothetical protein SAMN05428952_101520 [Nitrosomonas sp. Nm132]|nr:hypothetical protein SAMN05428952_101520 [Nitrosomonas sp. Nm132]